ncbi:MAG: flagellar basal body P-ring protein FlgI [Deltaproteobacteria bacterium]|nr:flagellar basal body P-ring protein FlgI [Deltaproteobacteria bacterium]
MALALAFSLAGTTSAAAAVRVKDLGHFDGVRKNQLIGYGLVVGLDGTGDTQRASMTPQALEAMLSRLGVRIDRKQLVLRNIAAVTVTAELPPFARPGTSIDVQVGSIGDARSLAGGTLLMTPLVAANGATYAVAQGPVQVGSAESATDLWRHGRQNSGRIVGGALVEREVPVTLADGGKLRFMLGRPDFKTAQNLAEATSKAIATLTGSASPALVIAPGAPPAVAPGTAPATPTAATHARALDGGTVEITVPAGWEGRLAELIATIEALEVQPDGLARVVVSASTGTVILGGNVRVSQAAVAYGGVAVDIYGGPTPERAPNAPALSVVPEGATLAEVVRGLNTLGVKPRALIDILEALAASGALHATLEVQP